MKANHYNKIAILLAAFNGEKYLHQQLISILFQSFKNFDLYISLDKSTDNSLNIIKKYAAKDRRIIILKYEGEIFGSSTNNFFRLIDEIPIENYDYIAFSDQDDVWMQDKLKVAINFFQNNPNYFGYSSNYILFSDQKKKFVNKIKHQTKYDYLFEGGGPGNTYLIKSEVIIFLKKKLKINQYFKSNFNHHDWLMYAFTRHFFGSWFIDERAFIFYRQHLENELGARNSIKSYLKRINFIMSGYAFEQVRLLFNFLDLKDDNIEKILKKSRKSGFYIILNFYKLRRSYKDKFIIIIIGFIKLFKII